MIVLDLPPPPSLNNLFANVPGKGRVKSARYRSWLTEAGWQLKMQKPAPIVGNYELHVVVPGYRGDLDNYLKAPSDLLVTHGLVEDDSRCTRVTAMRGYDCKTMRVVVIPANDPLPTQPATDDTWISLGDAVLAALNGVAK